MKLFVRGLMVAVMALASIAFAATTASADIDPDPYLTTAGTGSFTAESPLGESVCVLTGISVHGEGLTDGGTFTVLSAEFDCSGVVITGTVLSGTVAVRSGAVAATLNVLVTTIVGLCLYTASLTGSQTGPGSITASGGAGTPVTLFGFCSTNPTVRLAVVLPGLTIT